jgi:hypothetical protein
MFEKYGSSPATSSNSIVSDELTPGTTTPAVVKPALSV